MKTVTVVYEIVNEEKWRSGNPLNYQHDGLKAIRVGLGDALDARDALVEVMPFLEDTYYPEMATQEENDAMIHARLSTETQA